MLDENLSYEEEPVAILDREVRKFRSREIASIKVQWKNRPIEEATWEKEVDMREKYPHLFTDSGTPFLPCFPSFDRSGTNMGKLVSIVMICLVVLSNRFYSGKIR